MADYDEELMKREKLFGSSEEEEMSDLDGDQASDTEEVYKSEQAEEADYNEQRKTSAEEENQLEQANTYDEVSNDKETEKEEISRPIKLPSFKKKQKDFDEEENARLEEARREIRELKNNSTRTNEEDEEDEGPIDPQQALRDEIDRQFEIALRGGKKKRKRQDGESLENNIDEELTNLREHMRQAAEEDAIANGERRPAISKLKLLGEVITMLTNKHLQDAVLDNGLLETIRLWLEPLPDRSLPSLDIQNGMMDILDKLPISGDHLRESGVGKIVYFYTKSPRIEPAMKRKADQLVGKWSRLVIKRSENYRERRPIIQEYKRDETYYQRKKVRRNSEELEEGHENRRFVRVPQAVAANYDIAPQSTVRIDKSRSNKPDNTFRRLNNTMRSIKTGPKRTTPKVSIEGKGMQF
ncbi:uncharacterized protein BX663DRAFT_488298 [Cokeromyces recurvatus]|uniref:uncharacterized protein n=1 Tax=Cokeromyces recurvatus TaxID=90255 RepID=UPI00221FB922|nr:uncharacterized protein BX663DRAFT_488298 [Cokeromyces recurvatus]KAI7900686.1 hypothetical protein BX663DRAFT_488298 [Cokeromyces recurvatus]